MTTVDNLPSIPQDDVVSKSDGQLRTLTLSSLYHYRGGIAKIYPDKLDGPYTEFNDVEREIRIMLLAGDCAVKVTGRIVSGDMVVGYTMEKGTSLFGDPIDAPYALNLCLPERPRIIADAVSLIRRLHDRGIVHGDIKPRNLLYTEDGSMKLCDFEGATTVLEARPTTRTTSQYRSPHRVWHINDAQTFRYTPTVQDDIYALGVTVWEIYTCRPPTDALGQWLGNEDGAWRIALGVHPDISLVDDKAIRDLIVTLWNEGQGTHEVPIQLNEICSQRRVDLSSCRNNPRHHFIRHFPCLACLAAGNEDLNRCLSDYAENNEVLVLPPTATDAVCGVCSFRGA